MIQFFRRIRHQLLSENLPERNGSVRAGKFSKYILYAIGEIILVVLGILIALQINNWNEIRKLKGIEIKTLRELRSDLTQSMIDIKNDQEYFRFTRKSTLYILDHFENPQPYNDSLSYHFANMYPFSTFSINRTTFDNLRQSGANIITNDSLRIEISNFYTSYINLYKEIEKRSVIEHDEHYIKPMRIKEFSSYSNNSLIVRDYKMFIANPDNQQILNYSLYIFDNLISYQGNIIKVIQELIEQIDKEVALYEK